AASLRRHTRSAGLDARRSSGERSPGGTRNAAARCQRRAWQRPTDPAARAILRFVARRADARADARRAYGRSAAIGAWARRPAHRRVASGPGDLTIFNFLSQGRSMPIIDNKRIIRAPRGRELNAKSWATEAPLRLLMNNLDPDVAERPEELIVYGGIG